MKFWELRPWRNQASDETPPAFLCVVFSEFIKEGHPGRFLSVFKRFLRRLEEVYRVQKSLLPRPDVN
jgi:hypothetical protein